MMIVGAFSFSLFQSWKGGPVGGHFDRDVQGFAQWTKSFMKARRRNWLVYIIDFILFFFQDTRDRDTTEILEIEECIYIYIYIYDAKEIKIYA